MLVSRYSVNETSECFIERRLYIYSRKFSATSLRAAMFFNRCRDETRGECNAVDPTSAQQPTMNDIERDCHGYAFKRSSSKLSGLTNLGEFPNRGILAARTKHVQLVIFRIGTGNSIPVPSTSAPLPPVPSIESRVSPETFIKHKAALPFILLGDEVFLKVYRACYGMSVGISIEYPRKKLPGISI